MVLSVNRPTSRNQSEISCSSVLHREEIDHEYNHQQVTGQEIEFCTLAQLFPSLRVLSGGHVLDYLFHRSSVLCSSTQTKPGALVPQGLKWARRNTRDRHAARRFPRQIRSLKESREDGGEWLILAGVSGSIIIPPWGPPLLSRSTVSPGTRSVAPAHIHCSYRHTALAFQRTREGADEGPSRALESRGDIC